MKINDIYDIKTFHSIITLTIIACTLRNITQPLSITNQYHKLHSEALVSFHYVKSNLSKLSLSSAQPKTNSELLIFINIYFHPVTCHFYVTASKNISMCRMTRTQDTLIT